MHTATQQSGAESTKVAVTPINQWNLLHPPHGGPTANSVRETGWKVYLLQIFLDFAWEGSGFSPALNPSEHLWDVGANKSHQRGPKSSWRRITLRQFWSQKGSNTALGVHNKFSFGYMCTLWKHWLLRQLWTVSYAKWRNTIGWLEVIHSLQPGAIFSISKTLQSICCCYLGKKWAGTIWND